jgi:hypothetical protein
MRVPGAKCFDKRLEKSAQQGWDKSCTAMKQYLSNTEQSVAESSKTSECKRALQKLEQLVLDGLRHGFFDCTVSIETIKEHKRRLVIKAGRSYSFIIPLEEAEASS